ncbi:hypothetical protein ES703_20531 [subsurface metagenome]
MSVAAIQFKFILLFVAVKVKEEFSKEGGSLSTQIEKVLTKCIKKIPIKIVNNILFILFQKSNIS